MTQAAKGQGAGQGRDGGHAGGRPGRNPGEKGRRNWRNQNTGFSYRAHARQVNPARACAFETLRRVSQEDAYANLVLPKLAVKYRLERRDAAFATELAYGTLRLRGRYDAILARCIDRPLEEIDAEVLDVLRLGAHQLLGMRVDAYAAVDESVDLARNLISAGPAKFVNAVLRKVAEHNLDEWLEEVTAALSADEALATALSYPQWMVWALRDALVANGRGEGELTALLQAQNRAPYVHLCARPGLITPDKLADLAEEIFDVDTRLGDLSPHAVIMSGGDPGRLRPVERGWAGAQDEGSQFLAGLLANVALEGKDSDWLDLCAGPGGKTGLLGALAAQRQVRVLANEVAPHRAELVHLNTKALTKTVTVRQGDGRELGQLYPGQFDRVLIDAPCTGLGALRRRPESRWRRRPEDLRELVPLQAELLHSGLDCLRPGGIAAYVTCSPHLSETRGVVQSVAAARQDFEILDAPDLAANYHQSAFATAAARDFGPGPFLQLWPDRDHTDAMFCALLRRR